MSAVVTPAPRAGRLVLRILSIELIRASRGEHRVCHAFTYLRSGAGPYPIYGPTRLRILAGLLLVLVVHRCDLRRLHTG